MQPGSVTPSESPPGICWSIFPTAYTVALKAQKALAPNWRNGGTAVAGMIHPFPGGEHGIVLAAEEDPLALLGDAHREDIILGLVDIVQDGFGRAEGDLMLGAHAAKEDANAEFLHNKRLYQKILQNTT